MTTRKPRRKPARRVIGMTVYVSVPSWMTSAEARREVRTLIEDQSNYMTHGPDGQEVHEGTVKVRRMAPFMRPRGLVKS